MTGDHPAVALAAIADLHMAAGPDDPFATGDALVSLLDTLVDERGASARLAILGDLFDFSLVELAGDPRTRLATDPAATIAKLDLIAGEHRAVVEALRRFLTAGGTLDLLPGNHDLELLLPPVWRRVEELLGGGAGAVRDRLRLHPWILFVPGLVYAEHGHQHHDVNRVPGLLAVAERGSAPLPAGTLAAEWARDLRVRGGRAALGVAARAIPAALRWSRTARRPPGASTRVRTHAAELGLPAGALLAIDALLPAGALRTAAHTARRLAASRGGPPGGYMADAIAAVHAVLARHGAAVPFYATGHTHVPIDAPLPGSPAPARYLNPGTWARMRPKAAAEGVWYLDLERTDDGHTAALRRWTG